MRPYVYKPYQDFASTPAKKAEYNRVITLHKTLILLHCKICLVGLFLCNCTMLLIRDLGLFNWLCAVLNLLIHFVHMEGYLKVFLQPRYAIDTGFIYACQTSYDIQERTLF